MMLQENKATKFGLLDFIKDHANTLLRLGIALLLPLVAASLQWLLWHHLPPLTWLFFYPAVFFSAWIGGLLGSLIATPVAVVIGIYVFMPTHYSFHIEDYRHFYSVAIFTMMGISFGWVHERLKKTQEQLNRIANLKLAASQSRLDSALEAANAGLWEWNTHTNDAVWSDTLWSLFNLEPKSYNPSFDTWLMTVHPDDQDQVTASLNQSLDDRSELSLEWRVANLPEHQERWLMSKGRPELNANGAPILYRGIVVDITAKKKMAFESQRWADAFHYCAHGIAIVNPFANTILFCNPAFAALEGYRHPEELSGLPVMNFYPPEEHEKINDHFRQINQHGKKRFESIHILRDGSRINVQVDCVNVYDLQRNLLYRVATVQDITERKLAEAQMLLQSRALEAADNAILIADPNGVVEWVNPAFTKMSGFTKEESIGNDTDQLFKCDIRHPYIHKAVWETISKGETWHGEIVYERKDGTPYTEEQTITPVTNEEGNISHYIAIKQDVTSRKANEAELERYQGHLLQFVDERTHELNEALEHAEHLTKVKSAFLANMSHEIRSPMNAVLGFCYLLEQRPLDDEVRQLVAKIHYAGQSLLALINDILDFSKIEAGHLELESIPFNLADILEQISALMSVSAKDKKLELIINPPLAEASYLVGDSLRLQQILVNLITNAIKFTEKGEVELFINIINIDKDGIRLHFAVRDTGIGIPPEKQAEIFSAFTQADTATSRRFGGTGLGLSISRQLVNMMGGQLQLDSQVGHGSTFWFELLLGRSHQTTRKPVYLDGLNLLVVDNCDSARAAIANTVKSLGWVVETVDSGEAALSRVSNRQKLHKGYDILMIDWKLPGLDGVETALALKEFYNSQKDSPITPPVIIMVSAYFRDELSAQPDMAHVDTVLTKPVTPSALYKAVEQLLKNRDSIEVAANPEPIITSQAGRISGVRILVADDSEFNREIAKGILEHHGAAVTLANDGQGAIDWLTANPNCVDIVLMDVQMPVMDGYEATRVIHGIQCYRGLPIVALTAGAFATDEDLAREAGMDGYIAKPFNVEKLITVILQLVRCHLDKIESSPSEKNRSIGQSIHVPPESNKDLPLQLIINVDEGRKRFGNQSLYYVYLAKFLDTYKNVGVTIHELISDNDVKAALALLHKLKGVAGNLALNAVATRARELESVLVSGDSTNIAANILQRAIDEACISISQLTAKESAGIVAQKLAKTVENPDDLMASLELLLAALDQDSFSAVEPVMAQLDGKLRSAELVRIQEQLSEFDFRAAETSVKELMQELILRRSF